MNDLIVVLLALAFCGSAAAFLVMWANRDEWKKKAEIASAELQRMYCLDETRRQQIIEEQRLHYEHTKMLQDRLSAALCPHNDHVWRGGVCVKCGRSQE